MSAIQANDLRPQFTLVPAPGGQPAHEPVEQPDDAPVERNDAGAGVADEFALFMRNHVTCEACRVLERVGQAPRSQRLHVVLSAEHLVVTVADDLHEPGVTISARRVLSFPSATLFRLLVEPAPGVGHDRHQPAAGFAVLSWNRQGRRLVATGVAEGMPCAHERIYDAIEELGE